MSATLTFNLATGTTIHKSQGEQKVSVHVESTESILVTTLTGGFSGGEVNPHGAKSATLGITWACGFFPPGEYDFKATVTDTHGIETDKTIKLHLVP